MSKQISKTTRLKALAREIKENIAKANAPFKEAFKRGLPWAITAGRKLIEAKKLVGHGHWMKWVEQNCEISQSTANEYMWAANTRSS